MSILLSYGERLTDKTELLQTILPAHLHEKICTDEALRDATSRLRQVLRMSKEAYRRQKVLLPYVTCAHFKPAQRHSKNFLQSVGLILDVDKLGDRLSALRQKLERDERILLSFMSPSGQGLKLFVAFSGPITDTALYAGFYKRFAAAFAKQYQIEQYVDLKTCDAVRACFLAHDPNAYYNPLAVPVQPPAPEKTLSGLFPDEQAAEQAQISEEEKGALDEQAYRNILDLLNERPKRPPKPKPYVPEVLQEVAEVLGKAWAKHEIRVDDVIDIQYGKKFVLYKGIHRAEVNVFYGKKGFSVVATPKRGTHPALTELCVKLAELELFAD